MMVVTYLHSASFDTEVSILRFEFSAFTASQFWKSQRNLSKVENLLQEHRESHPITGRRSDERSVLVAAQATSKQLGKSAGRFLLLF